MKTIIFLITIFILSFASSLSASIDSVSLMHHSFGISGSSITGPGISYRYNFDNNYYIKTVGFLYYTESNDLRSDFNSFIGIELQKNFIQAQNSRFYGFAGTSYWYGKSIDTYTSGGITTTTITIDATINIGTGFGFELSVWEHFAVNFDFGVQYAGISYSTNSTDSYYRAHSRAGMGGGLGFSYQF